MSTGTRPPSSCSPSAFTGFLQAMNDNLPGLLDDIDTEFLHDFRVAVRRTRSTLKLGRPALPDEMRSRWEPEFKWLGDLTTPVRDLDVYELDLPTMGGLAGRGRRRGPRAVRDAPAPPPVGAAPRAGARAAVGPVRAAAVGVGRGARRRWPSRRAADGASRCPPVELAGRGISRAARRVIRNGTAVTADSPAEDLHTLRKRCKELRYALEVFAPVIAKARPQARGRRPQGPAGRPRPVPGHRGAAARAARVRRGDDGRRDARPQAVLAMGELIGHLDAEQDRARAEFDASFARFARPASSARLRPAREVDDEGPRVLQHQGRCREDVDRGEPGLPGRARGTAHAAVGPRPAGRRHVPVPGPAPGQGRRARPGDPEAPDRGGAEGDRLRRAGPAAGRLQLSQHGPRARRHQEAHAAAAASCCRSVADDYDVVFLDCPPSVSLVSENVLRGLGHPARAADPGDPVAADVRPADPVRGRLGGSPARGGGVLLDGRHAASACTATSSRRSRATAPGWRRPSSRRCRSSSRWPSTGRPCRPSRRPAARRAATSSCGRRCVPHDQARGPGRRRSPLA